MFCTITRMICVATAALLFVIGLAAQQRNIDDFFREFTADWVRHDPDLATRSRYLSAEEQVSLERRLTPRTLAWKNDRIQRAKYGLAELRNFDRAKITELQQISADIMQWQLQTIVDEEPHLDYTFPFDQTQGANVNLVQALTVGRSLQTEKDADNYVAALSEVSTRLEEAMAESRRLAAKGILPPRFILHATIKQMQSFVDGSPAQNSFVTTLTQKAQAIKSMPDAKREELRAQAEKIVDTQVYPAWKKAIALLES